MIAIQAGVEGLYRTPLNWDLECMDCPFGFYCPFPITCDFNHSVQCMQQQDPIFCSSCEAYVQNPMVDTTEDWRTLDHFCKRSYDQHQVAGQPEGNHLYLLVAYLNVSSPVMQLCVRSKRWKGKVVEDLLQAKAVLY